jgi:hypothetical protein
MRMRVWVASFLLVFGFMRVSLAQDNMVSFEITSSGPTVYSAPLSIPANTVAVVNFRTTNSEQSKKFNQGVLIDYPFGKTVYYSLRGGDYMPFWGNREIPDALYHNNYSIRGPCTISFFANSASLRANVYIRPDSQYSLYATKIFYPNEQTFDISVPNQSFGHYILEQYGFQSPSESIISSSGLVYSSTNEASIGYWSFNKYPTTNYQSAVAPWATTYKYDATMVADIKNFGPCTIRLRFTNQIDTNSLTVVRYLITGGNYSSSTNAVGGGGSASVGVQNVNLIVERSSDLQNWAAISSSIVTETAGKAFYRVKIVTN